MEKTVQNSSPRFLSHHFGITWALINAYTSRCFNDIHIRAEVAAQLLEKYQKPSPDRMRFAAMLEQNVQWPKYNAKTLLFPTLTEVQNFCYGKQSLFNYITQENSLQEVIKLSRRNLVFEDISKNLIMRKMDSNLSLNSVLNALSSPELILCLVIPATKGILPLYNSTSIPSDP